MPVALIAVAAVAAAGAAAAKGEAKRKAANQQLDALKNMKDIDPKVYAELAKTGDIDAWKNRLQAMRDVDPKLAEIRDSSLKSFTTMLAKNAENTNRSDEVAKMVYGLAQQFAAGAPAEMDLGSAFLSKAQERLGRGSELPPTYQAELIRSGLEQAGGAGVGASRKGPVAGVLGRMLGSAAMSVEKQNEQAAMGLVQAGQQLSSNRMNILAGLVPQFQNYEQAKVNLGVQGINLVNAETPSKIGLSGGDLVQLSEAARQERNKITNQAAFLEGQKTMAKGEATAGYFQAAGQAASAVGGMASPGGGTGSLLGGLTGGGNSSGAGSFQPNVGYSNKTPTGGLLYSDLNLRY